jgi:hypothetical protein
MTLPLKGCGHCGGTPCHEVDDEDFGIVRVFCSICGACGPFVVLGDGVAVDAAKEKASELWNGRAADAGADFQQRVRPWLVECFGAAIADDRVERGDRLLEEVLELLQAGGYDPDRVAKLVTYVWGRPAGEPDQEAGGSMVTFAAYCLAHGLDMHAAGERELARISAPDVIEKIRGKQALKAATIGSSPLPQALPSPRGH